MILAASLALFSDRVYFIGVSSRGLIGWIVIGLVAGWVAGHLARGRGFGCVVDVILGLIGAVIGGWIFTRLGISTLGFWGSLAAATVGAVLLVIVARLFAGSRD
ncbi:MAG TPA: GlsB/YeaQ/YmgE family stress response membrane protein [Candidatus Aquilonibacter sp.]|nr:GlsB/YeaQ/YmgE family stress response membrane protein [Candidatus Aquilonibacter sp.]